MIEIKLYARATRIMPKGQMSWRSQCVKKLGDILMDWMKCSKIKQCTRRMVSYFEAFFKVKLDYNWASIMLYLSNVKLMIKSG